MLVFTLFVGFVVGALTIIAVEALGLLVVIGRLSRKVKQDQEKAASKSPLSLDPFSHIEKQGVVWVFKPEKVPKSWSVDKVPRENKRKKEILEVTPLRKLAKIKDKSLILADSDGTLRKIQLKGCTVAAVSATMLSSRKWAKRYPIKVDNETTILYEGSKTFYMYLETSWEKESWCKALRIASCTDQEKLKWFSQLNLEFQSYLASLNTGYPLFMKPSVVLDNEPMDRSTKLDNSSSRVRQYLKKFSRKVSKSGTDNKTSWTVSSGREERKIGEKCYSLQDSVSGSGVVKGASIGKAPNLSAEGKMVQPSPTVSNSGSGGHNTLLCDLDNDDKIGGDEEALCWNLLISRFFFDAKRNMVIKNSIQSRIQRTLSNMRTPSYMGEITCTGIDLGSLPPYLTGTRVLPSDMNELWALEIDFQYSGGVVLHVESRLEVCASDLMEGKVDTNIETSYMKEVPTDILEGFEYLGKQLELSESTVDTTEPKDETGSELDGMRTSEGNRKASPSASKWKSVLNSVAKQVSQVPLSMAIKVASLRGTLRLHIKPPPSDQLWFGFTSMPDIVFELESFVGEHKINSGHIALFLISRFKAAIRETLVLPNCESVCIPWMLAEKDDWVPSKVAPFMWTTNNQEVVEAPAASATTTNTIAAANRETIPQGSKLDKGKKAEESTAAGAGAGANQSTLGHKSLEELRTPLLSSSNVERQLSTSHSDSSKEEEQVLDRQSTSSSQSSTLTMEGSDDGRLKRMGTRARMLGLGKKMGEKLEEKRRHIEERGRHMVERMKGP